MKYAIVFALLVSFQVHADYSAEDFDRDGHYGNELAPVLETPTLEPVPAAKPLQTDSEWSQSVRRMDLDLRAPKNSY